MQHLRQAGVTLGVLHPVSLYAVTVNPYYPKYRIKSKDYEPAYVDRDALLAAVSEATGDVPCFDVVQQGAAEILARVLAH